MGGYDQSFSNDLGRRKGWTVDAAIYPAHGGPWEFAAIGFDQPEGKGTMLIAGKELLIGKASSAYLGLSGGNNSDFLPQFAADLDVRLDLAAGWRLDLAGALTRFAQQEEIRMLQLGLAYQGAEWCVSAKAQQLTYEPDGGSDLGGILNIRLGGSDFGVWHNLRLAAGRGILGSTATGGGLSASITRSAMTPLSGVGGRFGRRSTGTNTSTGTTPITMTSLTASSDPIPQERLASFTGHWPLTKRFALKAEATWGEKVSTYTYWGGSLQIIATF
ncbi:MAG: YaiO family outer membrane beta-barrel protein [Holophagaceae bacterium]|uniref:YaiO family outer membrane beta-barrel protein n=1 Tax=Candidatus Geothrix skivensis TaxID=2954439 RepID=A0A9D7XHC6_9BACT|nr:YaiO family outer membrane beta-barrel protein [Candidatus Geothrix skivensis]